MDASLGPFATLFSAQNIHHHFIGQDQAKGVYAKELHIPRGFRLVSHKHRYDHLSILASGTIWLVEGSLERRLISGPAALTIKAGVTHAVHAVTDAVWFCVHPTDETDAATVDETLIEKEPA